MSINTKPTIFIGSSSEGIGVAKDIKSKLSKQFSVTLWPKIFDFNKSNLENLSSQISFFDYAILVATGDDTTVSRNKEKLSPRDNVIFEYGLFSGGIGVSRTFLVMERGSKLPSDLNGITLPYIVPIGTEGYKENIRKVCQEIAKHIKDKESTFDLGYLPSTTLAYGYFCNFIEKTVQRLLEDRKDKKEFTLENGDKFLINNLKVTILIPSDLTDDMFKKVSTNRLCSGWQKLKVDPKDIRDYDFSIDVTNINNGFLHIVDIPLTLNALNKSIELYSKKQHLGKSTKEEILETREINNFVKTLQYLISKSSIAKNFVSVEIINI